jgi:outer membrane lipoprotein-sorting protein
MANGILGTVNRFLRTAPTRRLLGVILGVIIVAVVGTTIAVAAIGSGPVPKPEPLARAIHQGLGASAPAGIYARVKFTDNLIGASEIEGSDPLLTGGTGRLWLTGHHLRIEVQGDNGDAQVVLNGSSFWAYDPAANTVFEGTLPASHPGGSSQRTEGAMPSIARIQSVLSRLAQHLNISRAIPGDTAGEPTYSVRVSPKHNNSLVGAVQLGWDAVRGVPLQVGLYARGNSTPVLALTATDISFGAQPSSVFAIRPPAGAKVVKVSSHSGHATAGSKAGSPDVTGVAAVSRAVSFRLDAPSSLAGRSRQSVRLLDFAGHPAALLLYGRGLGAVAVLEQKADRTTSASINLPAGGDGAPRLSLPSTSVHGSPTEQLLTAIGTLMRFSRSGVAYTVAGSVTAATADAAARGL